MMMMMIVAPFKGAVMAMETKNSKDSFEVELFAVDKEEPKG